MTLKRPFKGADVQLGPGGVEAAVLGSSRVNALRSRLVGPRPPRVPRSPARHSRGDDDRCYPWFKILRAAGRPPRNRPFGSWKRQAVGGRGLLRHGALGGGRWGGRPHSLSLLGHFLEGRRRNHGLFRIAGKPCSSHLPFASYHLLFQKTLFYVSKLQCSGCTAVYAVSEQYRRSQGDTPLGVTVEHGLCPLCAAAHPSGFFCP